MVVQQAESRLNTQLFTGSAGVPPAMSAQREQLTCESEHVGDHDGSPAPSGRSRPTSSTATDEIHTDAQVETFCSRFALIAGGTPAVPVKSMSG